MLSKHCEYCGFPIFEKDQVEYCPNCKYEKLNVKNDAGSTETDSKFKTHDLKYAEKAELIDKKIEYLFKKLESETEIGRINEISSAIKTLFKIKKYI